MTDDESLDLAENRKELGTAKRRAPSPPDEDSQPLLSISASDESDLADGELENQEPSSSNNGFRYQVRVIDYESALAALSIEANVLIIETYDMPDERKQWTTKFRDFQDCAFGEDDVITLFGLESTWIIGLENLRIVAADLTMTEKLKAYILHYMDSRQQQHQENEQNEQDQQKEFTKKVAALMAQHRRPFNPQPTIAGHPINLHTLYSIVLRSQGHRHVTRSEAWPRIADMMQLQLIPSVAEELRQIYEANLSIYEQAFFQQQQYMKDIGMIQDHIGTGDGVAAGLPDPGLLFDTVSAVATAADNDSLSSSLSTTQHENPDNAKEASIKAQQLPDDPYPPIDEELYLTERVWLTDTPTRHSATLSIYATHIAFTIEALKATWYIYSKNITHLRVEGIALLHGVVGEVPEFSGGLAASISHKQLVIRPWFGRIDNMKHGLEECRRQGVSTQVGEHLQEALLPSVPKDEGDASHSRGSDEVSHEELDLSSDTPIVLVRIAGIPIFNEADLVSVQLAHDCLHIGLNRADISTSAMRLLCNVWESTIRRTRNQIRIKRFRHLEAPYEPVDFAMIFDDETEAKTMGRRLRRWALAQKFHPWETDGELEKTKSVSEMPPLLVSDKAQDTPDRPGPSVVDLGATVAAHQPIDLREDEFVFELHGALLPISVYVEVTPDALVFHEPRLGRKEQWQIPISALEGLRFSGRTIYFTWRLRERDISLVAVDEQQAGLFMARLRAMIEGSIAQKGLQELLLAGRVDEVEETSGQNPPTLLTATTLSSNDELVSDSLLGAHPDDEPLAVVVEGLHGDALKHQTTIVFTAEGIQFHFREQNVLPRWWVMKVKSIQSWKPLEWSSSVVLLVDRMADSVTQKIVLTPQNLESEASFQRLVQGLESLKAPVATSESITRTKNPGSEPSETHARPEVDSLGLLSPQHNTSSRNLDLTRALLATPSFQVIAQHSECFGNSSRDWAPISGRLALGHSNMVMVSSNPLLDIHYDRIQSIALKNDKDLVVDQNPQTTKFEAESPESAQEILRIVRTRVKKLQRNAEATEGFLVTANTEEFFFTSDLDSERDNTVLIDIPHEKTTVHYPLHQYRPTNELERTSNAAAEAEVEEGDLELEIPWQLCTRKHYWKYIDSEVVDSNTDHPPSVAFSRRNGWTEIMASWVCKEAIREAGYKVTQIQKEVKQKTRHRKLRKKFETCFCIEQPLNFEQVKKLVERTVEIYRGKPLPFPPPGMNERRKRVAGFDYQGTPDVPHRPDIAAEIVQAATTATEDVDTQSYERIRLTTLAIPMHSLSQLITLNLEAMGLTFAHGFLPVYQSTMDYSSITNVDLRNATIYVTGDILVSATGRQSLYKAEEVTFETSDIVKASEIAQIIDTRSRVAMVNLLHGRPSEDSEPAADESTRVTTTVRGHEHDITNLGLDSDYIEALPEDLREEVIMQRIAEKQSELREQEDAEGAKPNQDATISRLSVVVGNDYATSEIRDSDANTVHSHDDRSSAREAELRQARSEKKAEQPDTEIHAHSSLDRWAQIRARAADQKARAKDKHAQESPDDNQSPDRRPDDDDDDTSGEETIESRVVRIKKRVAELTSDVATEAEEFHDPTKNIQLHNTGRDGYNHPPRGEKLLDLKEDPQQSIGWKGKSLLHNIEQVEARVQRPQDIVAESSLQNDEESLETSIHGETLQKGPGHVPFVIPAPTDRAMDDILNSLETSLVTKQYEQGVSQMGSNRDPSFRDNLQRELQQSLVDPAQQLQENSAQGQGSGLVKTDFEEARIARDLEDEDRSESELDSARQNVHSNSFLSSLSTGTKAVKSNLSTDGMQELITQDATTSNAVTTLNIMDEVQESILAAAHTTSEVARALVAKREKPVEAVKRSEPPDLQVQCVCCQCKRECFNHKRTCPWFDCLHDWDGCSACVVRVRGEDDRDA